MLTFDQAWGFLKAHESKGDLSAIGDDGRAGGAGQMWWVFRKDYWPPWCWLALEQMDKMALRNCLVKHPGLTFRHFYETVYNPHSTAPDLPDEPVAL